MFMQYHPKVTETRTTSESFANQSHKCKHFGFAMRYNIETNSDDTCEKNRVMAKGDNDNVKVFD